MDLTECTENETHEVASENTMLNLPDLDADNNFYNEISYQLKETELYDPEYFCKLDNSGFSILSLNIRSLSKNFDKFKILLQKMGYKFNAITLQETWAKKEIHQNTYQDACSLEGYKAIHLPRAAGKRGGGLCTFLPDMYTGSICTEISYSKEDIESLFVDVSINDTKYCVGNIYRPPNGKIKVFKKCIKSILNRLRQVKKCVYITGDFNLNIFNYNSDKKVKILLTQCMKTAFYLVLIGPRE